MYAIIETGGKQYKVSQGDLIKVELLHLEVDQTYSFKNVLAVSSENDFKIGLPYIEGACVDACVTSNGKHDKIIVYKYKPKKGFHKKKGHRQSFTELRIEKINV